LFCLPRTINSTFESTEDAQFAIMGGRAIHFSIRRLSVEHHPVPANVSEEGVLMC
jgi:hypothetical protein